MVEREVQWKRAWKRAMVKVGRRGATKGDSVVLLCDGGDPWNVCKLFQVPEAVSVEGEPAASETTESTEPSKRALELPKSFRRQRFIRLTYTIRPQRN
ncbi:hypothetical protein HZH66_006903 [Vespula vulgaris]|uniref:Uncharacterized protein n=1 Tax=Vespula vulgaris TaxID=7454 RepID=A0A834K2S4_VESVU|nr:hypothetical protein HZH66_006903 [Vespula vulgaris]